MLCVILILISPSLPPSLSFPSLPQAILPAIPFIVPLILGSGFGPLQEQAMWVLGNLTSERSLIPTLMEGGVGECAISVCSRAQWGSNQALYRVGFWVLSQLLRGM